MKIITDKSKLTMPVEKSKPSLERVIEVCNILEHQQRVNGGVGLSTIQLGITDVRACIIKVFVPTILINPKIVSATREQVVYSESCLSLPKTIRKPINTLRYTSLKVECTTVVLNPDELTKPLDYDNSRIVEFSAFNDTWQTPGEFWNDLGLLEAVCVQHEIDHLNGILITDRKYDRTVVRTDKKVGRNERVMIELPNGETMFVKYKKAVPYLESGAKLI